MTYAPQARYELVPREEFSRYSRPRRVHPDGSYEIHLVPAADPHYIPNDLEVWPLYHQALNKVMFQFPDAAEAALKAYGLLREKLTGLQNRDR